MTRVDFYLLRDTGNAARALFACRLAEKAFQQGHQIYMNTESTEQLMQLDDLLWTFRAGSFLPHAVDSGKECGQQPVLLGYNREPRDNHDVLVNLSGEVPSFFSRFHRVVEIVGGHDAQRTAARERYRFYKDRGYTLNTHEIS
jgi:DNA polymerase-3 subunit chi